MNLEKRLIKFFEDSESPVLFAGAGVSARAGLPIWKDFIKGMAEFARPYDVLTRHIIVERLAEGQLLNAASYFFLCPKIPEADKFGYIRSVLSNYDASVLCGLISLPFSSVITSNYDRSLFDAYAKCNKSSPISFSIDDPSIKGASFEKELFVARVHGRSEYPESIILSEKHYEELCSDSGYLNLLTNMFTRKQILFVGFSFLDPAIKSIFEVVRKHYGVTHDGRHLAILPKSAEGEFIKELEAFSIERFNYDDASGHDALWSLFETVVEMLKQEKLDLGQHDLDPFSPARQYLASCYARIKIGARLKPLKDTVAEGIVSRLIARAEDHGAPLGDIINSVHLELAVNKDDAQKLVYSAMEALLNDGLCRKENDLLYWEGSTSTGYDEAVSKLVAGVVDRCVVREGVDKVEGMEECISQALIKLILSRGWDLGAAFAANRVPENISIDMDVLEGCGCEDKGQAVRQSIVRSISNLISSPSRDESGYLVDLGRMAFALELIIQSPHDQVFYSLTLPEKIYLDANVLMPAVTIGHPFHEVYSKTIKSLIEAAARSNINLQIIAYHGFLNEVVSHKRLALDQYNEQYRDSDNLNGLIDQAKLFGVQNLNVFIGAFSMHRANGGDMSFPVFLSRYAPYDNEKALAEWLGKQGIKVCQEAEINTLESDFSGILHSLEKAYSTDRSWQEKDTVLIRHDAMQMAAINSDIKHNVRSVFVTADRRLREKISDSRFALLSNNMISHVGLMQLIDLLVGEDIDDQSVSRLIWGAQVSSETEQIRNYLIDQALNEYDDAIAMAMHEVVDNISEDVSFELERKGLKMQTEDCKEKATIMNIIGSFENRFFEKMRSVMRKD